MSAVIEASKQDENAAPSATETSRPPGVTVPPMDRHNKRLISNVRPPQWQNPAPQGTYNLVVVGGGSAGLVAATGAAGLGAKVALVERYLLGGDCLNVGCVPSKSLIRPAKIIGQIRLGSEMGIDVAHGVTVDFERVMERMRAVRAEISEHDSAVRFKEAGIDLYLGTGRFASPETLEVVADDGSVQTLRFKKALIATGSRAMELPIPGLSEVEHLTNETVFEMTKLPKRLAVIGAGPIGAELAQSFRRFGSEVTIFDIVPRLLGREDEEAAEVVEEVFAREGIQMALGAKIQNVTREGEDNVTREGEDKVIHFELDDQEHELRVDQILVAAGRVPNLEGLDLEAAGVEFHRQGVKVTDALETTNANIYAAGDIAYKYQFTHTADATARIVIQNALFPGPNKKVSQLTVPWCTYTDPEVAHVGLYPRDAEEEGIKIDTYKQPIYETDRGKADGEREGFVKIHAKKGTDKILGATIVASHAGEMVNEITLAMVTGTGLKTIANVIHPYPTQAEAIKKIADTYNRSRLTPLIQRLLKWWMARLLKA